MILAALREWQKAEYHRFKPEWIKYKLASSKKSESGVAPEPPLPERKFLFGIATIQAVMKRLSEQGSNGSLWARDEIAGLFKSLGQFTAKGEGEGLECLLPMWDGAPAPVDRVQHDDSYLVDASRLSIAGGLQPLVFRKIFSDPDDAQGLQARFLFALPKVLPPKRVKGYCHLFDKLPQFYRWIDTQFPSGDIKLSRAADALYDTAYESIGRQAESASTPAVRAWMRKLPGQLLRIALALHIIECYHESSRPKHELQADTLNRAIDFCRYYRSTFEVVQESVSDSDCVSSILLKIWDMAASTPTGLVVRDAYRSIKALARRAKEQGRSVAAYTTDLFYQLEKMGRGVVQRSGRVVRFVAQNASPPDPEPPNGVTNGGTEVTVDETSASHSLEVSPPERLSPVTQQNLEQYERQADLCRGIPEIDKGTTDDRAANSNWVPLEPTASTKPLDDEPQLLSQTELESWLNEIANVGSADDCMNCLDALNELTPAVTEQIWSSAEPLLVRFWEVASSETSSNSNEYHSADSKYNEGNNCSTREDNQPLGENLASPTINDEQKHNPGQGHSQKQALGFKPSSNDRNSSKVSPQQPHKLNSCDRQTASPSADQPERNTARVVKDLITGLWVRTVDGLYGHLGAKVTDGRWWVVSPGSRNSNAQSRLYAAADIIPMPTS